MGSGYADYSDLELTKCTRSFSVPVVKATPENTLGYGTLFTLSERDRVETQVLPWPEKRGRPLSRDSGRGGGLTQGRFRFHWDATGRLKAQNEAVGGSYVVAVRRTVPDDKSQNMEGQRICWWTREANYHACGGQKIMPLISQDPTPAVMLLALPGDDVKPKDFVAFELPARHGFLINPYVWHQPFMPVASNWVCDNEQAAVHSCYAVDTVKEFGVWLSIPWQNHWSKKE